MPDTSFETGDQVTYVPGTNGAIGGLSAGIYTVEKVDDTLFKLKDAAGNVVQVSQGTALGTQTFTSGSKMATLVLARVDDANDRIKVANHGFTADTLVTCASLADNGANNINGLTNEAEYRLKVIDANTFELYDVTTGQRVNLGNGRRRRARPCLYR